MRNRLPVTMLVCLGALSACALEPSGEPRARTCEIDELEPDDGQTLGTLEDDTDLPYSGKEQHTPVKSLSRWLSLHTEEDADHFFVDIRDTGISGNPRIAVSANYAPETVELSAYFICRNGKPQETWCSGERLVDETGTLGCLGTTNPELGPPRLSMQTDCEDTSTDDGTLEIRIRRTAPGPEACILYQLHVEVD